MGNNFDFRRMNLFQGPDDGNITAPQNLMAQNSMPQLAMNDAGPMAVRPTSLPPMAPKAQPPISFTAPDPIGAAKPPPDTGSDDSDEDSKDDKFVTKDDLQKAHDLKAKQLLVGSIGDALANQQSFGNFFLGRMNPHQDVMGDAKIRADMADQPVKDKQMLLKQDMQKPQVDYAEKMQDPDSNESKLYRSVALGVLGNLNLPGDAKSQMMDAIKNGNGFQISQIVDGNPLIKDQFEADAMGKKLAMTMATMGPKINQADERIHNQNLKEFGQDSVYKGLLNTSSNLKNAITNFMSGGATPQEFNELQQAVRSNAGIKGGGGVGEREETYLKSLGINVDKFKQFLTGDPQSVLKSDPEFAKQIVGVANLELQNKQKQAADRIDQLSRGHKSFYSKPGHEGLADDYNSALDAAKTPFGQPAMGSAPQSGGPQSSIINDLQKQNSPEVLKAAALAELARRSSKGKQ